MIDYYCSKCKRTHYKYKLERSHPALECKIFQEHLEFQAIDPRIKDIDVSDIDDGDLNL